MTAQQFIFQCRAWYPDRVEIRWRHLDQHQGEVIVGLTSLTPSGRKIRYEQKTFTTDRAGFHHIRLQLEEALPALSPQAR